MYYETQVAYQKLLLQGYLGQLSSAQLSGWNGAFSLYWRACSHVQEQTHRVKWGPFFFKGQKRNGYITAGNREMEPGVPKNVPNH